MNSGDDTPDISGEQSDVPPASHPKFNVDLITPNDEVSRQLFDSVVALENSVYKGIIALNGGALLIIISNFDKLPYGMAMSITLWTIGLLIGGLCGGCAYVSQQAFFHQRRAYLAHNFDGVPGFKWRGRFFGKLAMVFGTFSFIFFAAGAFWAALVVAASGLQPPPEVYVFI